MKVRFKKLHPKAVTPSYAKQGDAGLDLTAIARYENEQDNTIEYDTGLAVEIPEGYVGLVFPRSSICKKTLALTNSVGVVDSGYRGPIKFKFKANTKYIQEELVLYNEGEKVGQLVIMPYPQIELEEAEELSETARGTGGFGSSGS